MDMRVTIDNSGRVLLPKRLRKALRLVPGDRLDLHYDGVNVTLTPVRPAASFSKERGVWVFRTGEPLPVNMPRKVLSGLRQRHIRRELSKINPKPFAK